MGREPGNNLPQTCLKVDFGFPAQETACPADIRFALARIILWQGPIDQGARGICKALDRFGQLADGEFTGITDIHGFRIIGVGQPDQAAPRSVLELRGLGKDVWLGASVEEYLARERSAWSG